jgi:hypothetical protein
MQAGASQWIIESADNSYQNGIFFSKFIVKYPYRNFKLLAKR